MANCGKNTNSSQFFITLSSDPLPHLDGKYVVFGKVKSGAEILKVLNNEGDEYSGIPNRQVTIADCGEIQLSFTQRKRIDNFVSSPIQQEFAQKEVKIEVNNEQMNTDGETREFTFGRLSNEEPTV